MLAGTYIRLPAGYIKHHSVVECVPYNALLILTEFTFFSGCEVINLLSSERTNASP